MILFVGFKYSKCKQESESKFLMSRGAEVTFLEERQYQE